MNRLRFRGALTASTAILIGALLGLTAHAQPPPALPEGNTGIAASYLNDRDIASDPAVIFADDFESYASPQQLTGSGNYDSYYHESDVALDVATFFGGSQALRMRLPTTNQELFHAVVKRISPTRDALHMRVYARYQPGYGGIGYAHNGLRISGGYRGPGQRPDGTDFFLVSIENSTLGSEPEPGYTHAYVYHPEQDDVYGEHWFSDGDTSNGSQSFGQHFVARPKSTPPRGEWICFEVLVQLNTPGVRDGRLAVWQNGSLIADWTDLRFRDVASVKIDEIQLENGGQGSAHQNDKWYDNLVIATSYIGPLVSSSAKAPRPPTSLRVVR